MFHDDEFNRIFEQMSSSFVNLDDVFEMLKNAGTISGPVFYGYTMITDPDGKPVTQ
jgi:HSP20 family protein